MLWQRVLTAAVLIPLVVAAILYLDTPVLAALFAAMLSIGAYEFAQLTNFRPALCWISVVLLNALLMWLTWSSRTSSAILVVLTIISLWWIFTTFLLIRHRGALGLNYNRRWGRLLTSLAVLVTAWLAVVILHESEPYGPALVLYLFALTWVADTAAYFAGRAFGKRKLSPFVSPGKTWAGVAGALAGGAVAGLLLTWSGYAGERVWWGLVLLSLLTTVISIGGDLWESRVKREAGVKDSGALLPGHGGMLDRIDSLLAAAPVFALGCRLLESLR